MNYVDTAFKQLSLVWKLYNYALEGRIDLDAMDKPLTFKEAGTLLVLPDKVFESQNEFVVALENNLVVAFGAAAITLNRCREEVGVKLSDPILSEIDQFASLVYQIRNAFAHDISEPRWNIASVRYARVYEFGGLRVDLSNVGNKRFEYADLGGPDALFWMKVYAEKHVWP